MTLFSHSYKFEVCTFVYGFNSLKKKQLIDVYKYLKYQNPLPQAPCQRSGQSLGDHLSLLNTIHGHTPKIGQNYGKYQK